MATAIEKMQGNKVAVPHKIRETDHENIRLSRDAFEAKYRKIDEIEAKTAAFKAEQIGLAAKEMEALENMGKEDNKRTRKTKKVKEEVQEEV